MNMAFRPGSVIKSLTVTSASASAPRPKVKAPGKQLKRKEGWSSADVVAAGLATEDQKAAAKQLSRGVNYFGTGEFALDDGWSVQVVTEPKQPVVEAPAVSPPATKGGKAGRKKGKVDPQSDAGAKASAGLAEFMKAKEEETRRQKEAQAAAAARSPTSPGAGKKKNKKQKAPSLFGDLPEFDSAYRKLSKDNLKGEVVARLPGFDPTTGEFLPMPDQSYGVRQQDDSAQRRRTGVDKRRVRSALDVTMEDLLRQQRGEELIEEEEEVDIPSSSAVTSPDDTEEAVTLEDLRELLSMEDSEALSGLEDLIPDDKDLLAMLQPMLPSTPKAKSTTSPSSSSSSSLGLDTSRASSTRSIHDGDDEEDDEDVGTSAVPTSLKVRQRRRRTPAPRASRLRRQFQAEVVEEVIIEEGEEEAGGAEGLEQDDGTQASTSAVAAAATTPPPPPPLASQTSSTSLAATVTVSDGAGTLSGAGEMSSAASVPTTSIADSAEEDSAAVTNVAPAPSVPLAVMLKQVEAGTLDESQLTPLARKLLRYQQQYKQVQEREKERRVLAQQMAERQRRAQDGVKATTSSSEVKPVGAAQPEATTTEAVGANTEEGVGSRRAVPEGVQVKRKATKEEQEAELEAQLSQYFSPRKVKKLMQEQKAVDKHNNEIAERSSPEWRANRTLHQKLRIVGGKCQARRIWSSRGPQTRPMMERVRHAVFNMLHSFTGMLDSFDPNMRCLDLFAGTGSVGIEAVSRGCSECHFVEMDPWVVKNVTRKNVDICGLSSQAVFHTAKVEDFFERAIQMPKSHRPFDIISMCPPYLLVSYPQLFDLLERSPFLHENTFVVVEYPRQLAHEIPEDLGPLTTLRDREYGRTWIRIYGPSLEEDDE